VGDDRPCRFDYRHDCGVTLKITKAPQTGRIHGAFGKAILEDDVFLFPLALAAFLELDLAFRNGANRADMATKQTANALIVIALRLASVFVPLHSLMRAIVARDDATAAADALLLVDGRIDLIVTVERFGRDDVLIGEANELRGASFLTPWPRIISTKL
jgi:hypothetical protein